MRYFTFVFSSVILASLVWISHSESNSTEDTYTEVGHRKLLFATHNFVCVLDLELSSNVTIASGLGGATAVDYDLNRDLIVWSDVSADTITRYDLDGRKTVLVSEGIMTPDGLALDWIHGYVYWTDTGTDTIEVITLDGQLRKKVIDTDLKEPRAIALDPLEGWMFWTDWGTAPKIERAGMDGTHRSTIVSTGLGWPNGLSMDFDSRKIYWVDAQVDKLCSADYDGSNIQVILESKEELKHPFALDVFEDWVYWSDWNRDIVYKAEKLTGENIERVIRTPSSSPMGLRIYHGSKQPKGINYCEMYAECSHLCLPAPRINMDSKNFTCACPDGMKLSDDQRNCTAIPTTTTSTTLATTRRTTTTTPGPCQYDPYFNCSNGRCVKLHWVCDGDNDCDDYSDEENCGHSTTSMDIETTEISTTGSGCPAESFTCANGRCVKRSWVCDGDNDCRDYSDEQNCVRTSTTPQIPYTSRGGCPLSEPFKCGNGLCIRRGWICDGDNDCHDGSDEKNCGQRSTIDIGYFYPETEDYLTETIQPLITTASPIQHKTNKTLHRIQEEIGSGRIAGMVFGILVGLLIVIIVVGFFIYRRRNSSITNFENPVYRKESEVPLSIESKQTVERVILPI